MLMPMPNILNEVEKTIDKLLNEAIKKHEKQIKQIEANLIDIIDMTKK